MKVKIELKLNSQIVWGLLRDLDKNEDWSEIELSDCLRTFERFRWKWRLNWSWTLRLLEDEVSVVFHNAATVKFNEDLDKVILQKQTIRQFLEIKNSQTNEKFFRTILNTILNHIQAMAINVGAVFSVVELAKKMKNLKALIHVSTAYCNTHLTWWEMIRKSFF